jgi:type VI secretion system protein VasD
LNTLKTTLVLTLTIVLAACSQPYGNQTGVKIATASYLNPDINGKAAPVALTIYELRSQNYFNAASYTDLANSATDTLKTSLIDLHPYELQPGSDKNINLYISKQTRYIGLTAGYRNINSATWKKLITLNKNKTNNININLESENLTASIKN